MCDQCLPTKCEGCGMVGDVLTITYTDGHQESVLRKIKDV